MDHLIQATKLDIVLIYMKKKIMEPESDGDTYSSWNSLQRAEKESEKTEKEESTLCRQQRC